MPKQISAELRRNILHALSGGIPAKQLVKQYNVSRSFVNSLRQSLVARNRVRRRQQRPPKPLRPGDRLLSALRWSIRMAIGSAHEAEYAELRFRRARAEWVAELESEPKPAGGTRTEVPAPAPTPAVLGNFALTGIKHYLD